MRVWTDVKLVPEAVAALEAGQIELVTNDTGDLSGTEDVAAIIAGSLLVADAGLWHRAPHVRVLARCGIGFDRVDLDAAEAAGVCVVNTPEAPTESTAEFTLALMLAVMRRLPVGTTALKQGRWLQDQTIIGRDLSGQVLGLVGCGRIGSRVAELAQAFGMKVQAYDPYLVNPPVGVARLVDLPALWRSSDVISLHVPLAEGTRHLVGQAELAQFKLGAVLINTGRGQLVDERALAKALISGRLAGAGLDVWDPEPPSGENPLLGLSQVVATPHMAAFTHEGRQRSHCRAVKQVMAVLRDERPRHLLNPAVWEKRRLC